MNIAVLSFHRLGGSGIIAHEISHEMAKAYGYYFHFVGLKPPYRMESVSQQCACRLKFHQITLKSYDVFDFQPYVMSLASQLSQIIIRENIDVIHSHYAIPHALAAILAKQIAKRENVRTVTTLHGTDVTIVGSSTTMKPITQYSILKSDHVVTVSRYLRAATEKLLEIPAGKIQVIPNFIDPKRKLPVRGPVRTYAGARARKLVLHSSNLRAIKAPLDVLEIYYKMLEKGLENSQLGIIGMGPYYEKMRTRVQQLKLTQQVHFLGERKDINEVYSRLGEAALFLLPSKGESFGLAALEAMACGVPVIAAALGGILEVIKHAKNGFLYPAANLDQAATYGVKLLNDPKLYQTISQQARLDAIAQFPLKDVLAAYQAIYTSKKDV